MHLLFSLLLASAPPEPAQKSGMHRQSLELPNEESLRYTIAIPKGYEPGQPRALVLALHYGGKVTPFYGGDFLKQLVEPGLRSLGAILVAPDCRAGSWANPQSESEVMELLDYVRKNYSIKTKRILVTGYSMGATGTWYLLARHPDLFSAALVVAGTPSEQSLGPIGKIPVYALHSQDDGVVPLKPTLEALQALEIKGAPVELDVVRGIAHFEVPRFVRHLRKAAKWVANRWEELGPNGGE